MLNILSMALIPILVDFLDDPLIQLIVVSLTFGIGLLQGVILGRAILQRFPRLQNHVKTVSVTLFVLFLINAVLSVPRFQSPEKIDLTNLSVANPADVISSIFLIFGMNTGFLTVLAISIMVMTFVILKFTNLHGIVKGFVFFFSSLLLVFTALSRFTDLTPSAFEVLLYFLYQLGITIGILFGTIRKIKPPKLDLK
tara:strand:- start:214 stop:804 length:591 start_codon:yes stop_codon:yes gene_type:complete